MEPPEHSAESAASSVRAIPLTQGRVALVDAADYAWLSRWRWRYLQRRKPHYTGYAIRSERRTGGAKRTLYMHRLIAGLEDLPRAAGEVDHRNHDGLDNRRANLRVTDASGNNHNRLRSGPQGVSGVEGVHKGYMGYQRAAEETWTAIVRDRGWRWCFGPFPSIEAAAAVRREAKEALLAGLPPDHLPHLATLLRYKGRASRRAT